MLNNVSWTLYCAVIYIMTTNVSLLAVITSQTCISILSDKIVIDSLGQGILTKLVQGCICYALGHSVGTRTLLRVYPPCLSSLRTCFHFLSFNRALARMLFALTGTSHYCFGIPLALKPLPAHLVIHLVLLQSYPSKVPLCTLMYPYKGILHHHLVSSLAVSLQATQLFLHWAEQPQHHVPACRWRPSLSIWSFLFPRPNSISLDPSSSNLTTYLIIILVWLFTLVIIVRWACQWVHVWQVIMVITVRQVSQWVHIYLCSWLHWWLLWNR